MELLDDKAVIVLAVGHAALFAVLDALFSVAEITAAVLAERVEGAVTEKAVEFFFLYAFVAGEGLSFLVAEECVMLVFPIGLTVVHNVASLSLNVIQRGKAPKNPPVENIAETMRGIFEDIIPYPRSVVNLENESNFLLQFLKNRCIFIEQMFD